jgi:transposase
LTSLSLLALELVGDAWKLTPRRRLKVDPPRSWLESSREEARVLSVEDWAEIRRLHRAEGIPIKQMARVMGCSKNTVKRALAAAGPPRYERAVRGSVVDAVEPRIRELLAAWPTMPATVIAERIGWTRGLTVLKDRVRELRPVYLPPDPASRTAYAAGEVAQCDLWFPAITLPVGFGQTRPAARLPVLVMVTGYARWLTARLIPSRAAEDLFAGWWQLISQLGRVPQVLVWDGEGAVGQRRRRQTVLTEQAHVFRGVLGAKILICDPGIGGQGAGRAGEWLSGDLVSARPVLQLAGGRQSPSWATGWPWSTSGRGGCWAVPRWIGSRPTGPRCCRCRRWRPRLAGERRCGCHATTTCGWTATTTRSTRRWSAVASR